MNTNEILESNKLIALFMNDIDNIDSKVSFNKSCSVNDFKYHSSWDWLIPIVEKIENLGNQTFYDLGVTSYSRFEIKHNHIKLYWSKDHKYQLFLEVIPKWMRDSSFGISKNHLRINITKETTKIESLWLAVVEFIKWYNLNK